jgi:hypothetical protein
MSAALIHYLPLLKLLCKVDPVTRKKLLKEADGKFITFLAECCLNTVCGNVHYTPTCKESLRKHVPVIRKLASRKLGYRPVWKKRKLLVQNGGFLPLFLAPIITLASSLIGDG